LSYQELTPAENELVERNDEVESRESKMMSDDGDGTRETRKLVAARPKRTDTSSSTYVSEKITNIDYLLSF
jgi:hypothetical protein